MLWAQDAALKLPVTRQNSIKCRIEWRPAAYHTVSKSCGTRLCRRLRLRQDLRSDARGGWSREKNHGAFKPITARNVLLKDHHPGYISWEQFEANQQLILENAHMKRRTDRKSARGGRALLTGLVRCGRCGRTMRVFYGSSSGHPHR